MDRNHWIARHVLPHEPALRRFLATQKMPVGLDADDIVQEVYGVIADMETVAHIQSPRNFILGTARNLVRMQLRRAQVVSIRSAEEIAGFDPPADEPTPETQVSDREQLHLLALAIARIREPWRTAFLLRAIDELPHKEIGERLGMTENAVQKSHAKTLAKLIGILGRGGNEATQATTDDRTYRGSGAHERHSPGD